MQRFSYRYALLALAAYSVTVPVVCRADVPAPLNPGYQRVWAQDFTTQTTLAVAAHVMGSGTWIAHTPSYQDWFTFQDAGAPYHPFALTPKGLTIRVQKDGHDPNNWFAGYSGGLLSSMDGAGAGFAQQYGYFEASMKMPGGPNTWPAFWLLDAPSLTDKALPDGAEIDVTESYGNWGTGPGFKPRGNPNFNTTNWHRWVHNGNPGGGGGAFAEEPGMTTGFHTYGVDVEPDFVTWYFDRKQVYRIPTFTAARRPMFVLLNLALGGGTHNNADGSNYDWNLTPTPSDLLVKYVAVWASPNSPNYRGAPAAPTQVSAVAGTGKVIVNWSGGGTASQVYRGVRAGAEGSKPIAAGVTSGSFLDIAVRDGTTYFYSVRAVNATGRRNSSAEVQATPGAAHAARAEFVRTDTATQGNWPAVYGGDGYEVFGASKKSPTYAVVSANTDHTFKWPPTPDVRALRAPGTPAGEIAAKLHGDAPVTFDIDLSDDKAHQVAFYFLDYDRKGEVNRVEIRDATFGDLLTTRTFPDFANGVYAVFSLKGHVVVSIANSAPKATNSQATVSGVFFGDKAPGAP
jgi:hypothetical protein